MTENELLLIHLIEEQSEVIQRICKALRFGLEDVQEGQNFTNKERINQEITDEKAVIGFLVDRNIVNKNYSLTEIMTKGEKIKKYLQLSKELGILEERK